MFYFSKNSKAGIVHASHCSYAKMIGKRNIGYFLTLEEARAAGYRLCNRCAPINRFVRGKGKAINEYCRKNGMLYYLKDGCMIVKTPRSAWKIITAGRRNKYIFLYHRNTYDAIGGPVRGYHSQSVRRDTILEYMEYIAAHEAYRWKNPFIPVKQSVAPPPRKGTKRWRKEQRHLQDIKLRNDIFHTLHLIDRLSGNGENGVRDF